MRLFSAFSLLSLTVAALAKNIIVVDDSSFDDVVLNSDKTSFVKFYAEWCSHCKKMIPEWERLADSYADNEEVQIVEIDADKARGIGKRYNIASYPSLKLFRADSLSDPVEYSGKREYEYFSNFLVNQIGVKGKKIGPPSKVVQVHDGNIEKLIENKNRAAVILFTKEKDCDDCIGAKKSFDDLSHAFHKELEKVIVGEAKKNGDEPTDWIREMYGITEYPAAVFINRGDLQQSEIYNGSLESSDLIEFVNSKLGTKRAINGLLDTQAGIILDMEDSLKKFIGMNIVDRRSYVSTFIENLKKVDDLMYKNEVKYYALIVNQFIAGNNQYVDLEIAKYTKQIEDKVVDSLTKDLVNMKLNLLKHIKEFETPETYRDAKDIMAEREKEANEDIKKDEL
jgi:protein disulfide-isomerase A6